MDNNLFLKQMAHTTDTYHPFDPGSISIRIQHHRIIIGFISKKCPQRRQDGRTEPHPHPYNPFTVSCHLVSTIIYHIINNKHKHRYYHRHPQSAFTDNAAERRSNKKEKQTGKRNRYLLVPFRSMPADLIIIFSHVVNLKAIISLQTFGTVCSRRENLLFLHQRCGFEKTVYIVRSDIGLCNLYRIFF